MVTRIIEPSCSAILVEHMRQKHIVLVAGHLQHAQDHYQVRYKGIYFYGILAVCLMDLCHVFHWDLSLQIREVSFKMADLIGIFASAIIADWAFYTFTKASIKNPSRAHTYKVSGNKPWCFRP